METEMNYDGNINLNKLLKILRSKVIDSSTNMIELIRIIVKCEVEDKNGI